MAVGSRFNDPDTQAAIAAQSGVSKESTETPGADEAAAKAAEAKAAEEAAAKAAEAAAANADTETPPDTDDGQEPDTSAESLNMDDVKVPSQEDLDKTLAAAGFDPKDLGKELAENDGKLTPETVKALKEKFDATEVDNAVADFEKNFAAEKEKLTATNKTTAEMNDFIYGSLAGGDIEKGKEHLKTLSEWAKTNIPADKLKLINKKLASGDKDLVSEGLQQAVTMWKKGQRRPMMTGDAAAASKVDETPKFVPLSKDEFVRIMATEKYNKDPEYAAQIDSRRRKTMESERFVTPEYSASRPPLY